MTRLRSASTLIATAVESRQPRRPLLDLVVGGMIVFAGIPQYYTLNMRVGGIPVLNGFYVATILLVVVYYYRILPRERRLPRMYTLGGLYLVLVTAFYFREPKFEVKYFFQDILAYTGLPVGVALAKIKGRRGFSEALPRWYFAATVTFAVGYAALMTGYVPTSVGGGRIIDQALFYAAFFVMMTFPSVWCGFPRASRSQRSIAAIGMAICLAFAMTSATRSILLTFFISLMSAALIEWRRSPRFRIWLGGVIAVSAAFLPWGPCQVQIFSRTH